MGPIEDEIKKRAKEAQKIMAAYLPEEKGYQKTVIEAMNYSFLAGGKRLRPVLMRETYRLCGGTSAVVEPFMAAIEMIHTYSLIHDDLPAMDNDDYRRGRKTTHVVYGEAFGILAGDGLLNLAFETALAAHRMEPDHPYLWQAMEILADRAGIHGMIGGQVLDMEAEGCSISLEKLQKLYEWKTGALIEASMRIGAILAGASESVQQEVSSAALEIGIAFQIQDDILDVVGDQEKLGKPVGSDAKNQKTTYITLCGMKQARARVKELTESAAGRIEALGADSTFLVGLIHYLTDREY